MLNFEATSEKYREDVRWNATEIVDTLVTDHLLKGGSFDAVKITKMFNDSIRTAQLVIDLFIGVGLSPLREGNDDENTNSNEAPTSQSEDKCSSDLSVGDGVRNLKEGDTKGPTGSIRSAERVSDTRC